MTMRQQELEIQGSDVEKLQAFIEKKISKTYSFTISKA